MTDPAEEQLPLYTIGHARHPLDEFVALLQGAGVTHLADVRSFPRSRTNPQFNIDTLPAALAPHGISYQHMPTLGGRRNLQKNISPQLNAFWDNRSFHNYADYSQQPEFEEALEELVTMGPEQRTAYMCSETVWWRCHRRIITDWLLARGETVWHIMPDHINRATLTRGAAVDADGRVTYPATSESCATTPGIVNDIARAAGAWYPCAGSGGVCPRSRAAAGNESCKARASSGPRTYTALPT